MTVIEMGILERCYRRSVYILDLDDGSGNADWRRSSLSATKLCGYLVVFVGLGITVVEEKASAAANALVGMGITALFGRSMWKSWLGRNSWTSNVSQAAVEVRETREIVDRRTQGGDIEPTP